MPPITEKCHPSHPKCMLKLESSSIPYICDGCQEIGFGMCYRCRKCKFYIHKECAILPPSSTYHHHFEKCKFEFFLVSPASDDTVCDACGRDIKGFVYHCSKKRFDMHPQCAKLPLILIGKDVKLELEKKPSMQCQKCRIKSSSKGGPKGWSYVSTCGRYCLHVACIKEMIYEAWEKSYFSEQDHDIYKNNLALPSTIPSTSKGHRGRSSSRVRSPGTHGSSLSRRRDRGTSIEKGHRGRSSSCVRSSDTRGSSLSRRRDHDTSIDKRHRGRSSSCVQSPGTHGSSLSCRRDRGTSIDKRHRGRSSSYVRSPGTHGSSLSHRRDRSTSLDKRHRGRSSSCVRSPDTHGRSRRRDRGKSIDKRHRGRSSSCVRSPGTHGSYSSSHTRRSSLKGRVPSTTSKEIVRHGERKPSTRWNIARSILLIILSAICGEPITFSTSLISFLASTISWFTS